jgi:hypothetical protein
LNQSTSDLGIPNRFRLDPSRSRALGFVDADLRHPPHDEKGRPVGAWFNLQEASDFSDKRRSEIETERRVGKLPKKITVRKRTAIEDLSDDWSKSAEFKALSVASQSSDRKCISANSSSMRTLVSLMTKVPIGIGCRRRAVAVFGFLACDTVRQAIVRAGRLTSKLIRTVDSLFATFPLDEEN